MVSVQHYVQSIAYFQGIASDELHYIAEKSVLRTFAAGEVIFIEGQPADGLWIVEAGSVKIYKLNPDGAEHILHLRGPGTTFNDIAALDGGQNPASAMALSAEVQTWLIPAPVIREILSQNPQVALNVIRLLAVRVRALVGQIEDLALYS